MLSQATLHTATPCGVYVPVHLAAAHGLQLCGDAVVAAAVLESSASVNKNMLDTRALAHMLVPHAPTAEAALSLSTVSIASTGAR